MFVKPVYTIICVHTKIKETINDVKLLNFLSNNHC